jgi:uncharacterized protein YcgI (DUF1989 family)
MAVQSKKVPRAEARVGPADAKAYEVHAGEYVQIEDLQGCQVPGQGIYDGEGNRVLELVEDIVGRHDTFGIACDREYYDALGYPDPLNCNASAFSQTRWRPSATSRGPSGSRSTSSSTRRSRRTGA